MSRPEAAVIGLTLSELALLFAFRVESGKLDEAEEILGAVLVVNDTEATDER